MKPIFMAIVFASLLPCYADGSDAQQPKSDRFKVSYVETEKLPPLTVISQELDKREIALAEDKRYVAAGLNADELNAQRRDTLQSMYFPIRVTDLVNGNTYEVQTDRRTIIAKSKDGKELWKINPYVDSGIKLTPLQAAFNKHPYIGYFGPPWTSLQTDMRDYMLQITFSSGTFGGLDLRSGKFIPWGAD